MNFLKTIKASIIGLFALMLITSCAYIPRLGELSPIASANPTDFEPTAKEPSITKKPLIAKKSSATEESPVTEEPIITEKPLITKEPLITTEPPVTEAPANEEPVAKSENYHPIVCGDILIGGSINGNWIEASGVSSYLAGGEIYDIYNINGFIGTSSGSAVVKEEEFLGPYFVETLDLLKHPDNADFVAVSADWEVIPYKPYAQSTTNETYIKIVADLLRERGFNVENKNIDILQNYRVDFEGDGQEEVIIYAENKKLSEDAWAFDNSAGCFSILILRKIVGDEVKNFVIYCDTHTEEYDEESFYYGLRTLFRIVAVADLNGDGKMELVASWGYYEGYFYAVFDISENGVELLLENGIGV